MRRAETHSLGCTKMWLSALSSALIACAVLSHASDKVEEARASVNDTCRRRVIKPIFYLHVPKCGSSIATMLVQYACPTVPKDVHVKEPLFFSKRYPRHDYCPGGFARFNSGHHPVPKDEAIKHSGRLVTMLRRPRDRIVSGFLHDFHDCKDTPVPIKREGLGPPTDNSHVYQQLFQNKQNLSNALVQYFDCVEGCSVKQLTGRNCGSLPRPAANDINRAAKMLNNFGFIGITEEWEKTVDLWSKMFGGEYNRDALLHNSRPSKYSEYTNILQNLYGELGLHDLGDGIIYEQALSWFNRKVHEYQRCS